MNLTKQQSIGLNQSHLSEFKSYEKTYLIHKQVINDLKKLIQQAKQDNIELAIVSSYRSFQQQLTIWNEKWYGKRVIYSPEGQVLNHESLSNIEKLHAVGHWSALPGLSRHHWGTDLDIFDYAAIKKGHQVELIPEEFDKNGVCSQLNYWLEDNLQTFGFFRPYKNYQGGVAAEPWHISHKKTSQSIFQNFDSAFCKAYLKESVICENLFIQENFDHHYENYFCNICEINSK